MAKVLVVEDDSGIALGLEDALRLEGHQVELSTSGLIASRRASMRPSMSSCSTCCCRARTASMCAVTCARPGWTRRISVRGVGYCFDG